MPILRTSVSELGTWPTNTVPKMCEILIGNGLKVPSIETLLQGIYGNLQT